MSAFEKLPREVRDLIYEHCLLYHGEIIPFPTSHDYEKEEIKGGSKVSDCTASSSQQPPVRKDGRDAFLGYPHVKREAFQTEDKPCVALLGVNSAIRDEAACILFGENVWRLSPRPYAQDDKYRLWETYARYFRQVVTSFDARDIDETQLLDISMQSMERVDEDEDLDHFDQAGTANIHQEQLSLMKDPFIAKRNILRQMDLKSLSFDFANLFCPSWCCRREALQICVESLGPSGPWYRSEREQGRDLETKLRTDVKVLGLKNDKEKKLFWKTWGLKVD
ncbi:hypothetical protein HO133_004112 [Letharia lupina]|uniref:Uncharacterized protein n=1 Tax=Letharia lupina TaxID=560253 RepID=A0A8H6C9U8_9LECA|nr:uncharacterized protein HO133_004112 [Letharia lupina]KAF6219643.1 hypothetical protein HO133_004112 [Letharia lupina]